MSYEQFVREITELVGELVGERVHLSQQRAIKNNGYERIGITFSEPGLLLSPSIYLEEYYEKYGREEQSGETLRQIAKQVADLYCHVRREDPWNGKQMLHYEEIRDRIIYKLVNRDRNHNLLSEVPYREYQDLAILYYVLADIDLPGESMAVMLIRKEHMDLWNVGEEELYRRAVNNTERHLPYEFSAMYAVIRDMLEDPREEVPDDILAEEHMYVLTNRFRNCGASAMLYQNRLEQIGMYFGENYYIIPSSIHELILMPESRALARADMDAIVGEVNESHVKAEEYLSDHVYYYDRAKGELCW